MNNTLLPETFRSVLGLGAPARYFPIKKINRIGSLVASIIFLIGSGLVLLYGIYTAYVAYQNYGLAMIDDKLIGPLVISGVLFLVGVVAGWSAYANWSKGVAIYERGFASRSRKGLKVWRWEDVVAMKSAITRHYTNGVYTGTTHVYTLMDRQNERLVLGNAYGKVEELAKAIEQGTFPILYNRASAQYNTGAALNFGPVVVSKAGIQIGKKVYPWTEVEQVSIRQGILKITKKDGGWFSGASVPASAIPNLRVLLSIIDQVAGIKIG